MARVQPIPGPVRMYGQPSEFPAPPWSWVAEQLRDAGTYWVVPRSRAHPHPRPVWGVWAEHVLFLSIGSPVVARSLADDPTVTVHLDSGTDVVVLEGFARTVPSPAASVIDAYDAKYEWTYSVDEYGPMTRVDPAVVLAWRSAGWAGRGGFQQVGRWHFA